MGESIPLKAKYSSVLSKAEEKHLIEMLERKIGNESYKNMSWYLSSELNMHSHSPVSEYQNYSHVKRRGNTHNSPKQPIRMSVHYESKTPLRGRNKLS